MMTLQDTVRVMIADDNFDMRLLVRATLGSDARVDVVAEAEDGTTAVEAFRESRPDVCVLDYRMPGRRLPLGTSRAPADVLRASSSAER